MKIDCLIFSKNRSCQCDLLIRSILDNFDWLNSITILYKSTSNEFENGYNLLKNKYPQINYIQQTVFENDTKKILNNLTGKYILPLCDDDIIINKITKEELKLLLDRYDSGLISCVSLRMNENCDYCYSAKKDMKIPNFLEKDKFLLWNWTEYDPYADWGYPFAINGTIYSLNYLKQIISDINFVNVNELEGQMNFRRDFGNPLLISFRETKIFNSMQNYVKAESITNKDGCSIERLNELFLQGNIISTENLYHIKMKQVHGPLDFKFIRSN